MKSIGRRFLAIQAKRPEWSSLINFNAAVTGQRLSRDRIGRAFKRLVDADDYVKSDVREILADSFSLSWGSKRTPNDVKSALEGTVIEEDEN